MEKLTRREFLRRSVLGAGGLIIAGGGATASYALWGERYTLRVNRYPIPVPNLPAAFTGVTLLQITDMHYGPNVSMRMVDRVLDLAAKTRPDAIVCTGDYVQQYNGTQKIDEIWPRLKELQAPLGVYSVLGNHDHWADTTRSLEQLEASGQSVRHRAVRLERDGQSLWLGGTGDLWEDEPGIDQAFAAVDPQACKIVLSHNPDMADVPFQTRIDLMISGHTHGGQFVLPFIGAPFAPVSNPRYIHGLVQTGRFPLFISRGIGCGGVPLRFNCPPELALLELIPAEKRNT